MQINCVAYDQDIASSYLNTMHIHIVDHVKVLVVFKGGGRLLPLLGVPVMRLHLVRAQLLLPGERL